MKRGFNIAANICAIVLMAILIIGSIVLLTYSPIPLLTGILIGIILFCVATVTVAAIAIAKFGKSKIFGLQITVAVLVGIIAILEFVGGGVVYGILCLIPIAFEIVAMCLPDKAAHTVSNETAATAEAPVKTQTTDEKIAELKHLKELNVITDEQYNNAVNAIFDEFKQQ